MSVTDFASLREAVINANHLSTDFYAESGTYLPAVGNARSIAAKVSLSQDAQLEQEGEQLIETIDLLVKRDASAGIDRPQIGDRYLRPATRDPPQRVFLWSGEVRSETGETHWTLIFWRHKDTARGASQ